jgi:hypothetical protein
LTCLVPQFSQTADQATVDLAQAFGLHCLAKHHGHELIPGSEPFGVAFEAVSKDQLMKPLSVEESYQLTEQARMLYLAVIILVGLFTVIVLANITFPFKGDFFNS